MTASAISNYLSDQVDSFDQAIDYSNIKKFDDKLQNFKKARTLYVARSLALPLFEISNARLCLIRRLGWLLVLFQILDGFFTIHGIGLFGLEAEGNPLVRNILEVFGANLGIGLVKLSTIAVIFCICIFGCRITWLSRALVTVSSIYFIFALLPWSFVLASYYGASLGIF